eukprot:TRINITY_DN47113_c0_g1_i1.p1 TRINITY_DN47113_c0_g1~~TRINITY_DN47113_c0_g1_i1.p1  ORF type:complete len:670 (+),score=192.78 TRINITY_DN47113_c0_g1_i1:91-2010(+)
MGPGGLLGDLGGVWVAVPAVLALLCAAAAAHVIIVVFRRSSGALRTPKRQSAGPPLIIRGLKSRKDLNGKAAKLGSLQHRTGRWAVHFDGGGAQVLPANIELQDPVAANGSDAASLPPSLGAEVLPGGGVRLLLQGDSAAPRAVLGPAGAPLQVPPVSAHPAARAEAAVSAWCSPSCRAAVELLWEACDGFGDESDAAVLAFVPPAARNWAARWLAVAADGAVPQHACPGGGGSQGVPRFYPIAALARRSSAPTAALFEDETGSAVLCALGALHPGAELTISVGQRGAWAAADCSPQPPPQRDPLRALLCPSSAEMQQGGKCKGYIVWEQPGSGDPKWTCAACQGSWAEEEVAELRRESAYPSFAPLSEQEGWLATLVRDHEARPWHYSLAHHVGTMRLAARRLGPRHWTVPLMGALMLGPAADRAEGARQGSPAVQVVVRLARLLCAWARDVGGEAAMHGHANLPALLADEHRGGKAAAAPGLRAVRVLGAAGEQMAAAALAALTLRGVRRKGAHEEELAGVGAQADPAWPPGWVWDAWEHETGSLGADPARAAAGEEKLGNACDHRVDPLSDPYSQRMEAMEGHIDALCQAKGSHGGDHAALMDVLRDLEGRDPADYQPKARPAPAGSGGAEAPAPT